MKNSIFLKKIVCFLLLITIAINSPDLAVSAKSSSYTATGLERVIGGVLAYKQKQAEVSSVQKLIDGELAANAGKSNTADWLTIALCRYKGSYDYNKYRNALDAYVSGSNSARATDLQRIALAYSAVGSDSKFIEPTINNSIGKLGIMSYIYGLILLDSRDYSCKDFTRDQIVKKILSLKLSDGGWALNGSVSDVDITAMALQALAPYRNRTKVSAAIEKALAMLSKRQLDTGDYKSWGNRCCESTAQVITALSALNINCQTDKRFIKKNKSLIDGLMAYRLSNGGFCHIIGGKSDNTASVQAMYSLIAVWRQKKGSSSFYSFSGSGKSTSAVPDSSNKASVGTKASVKSSSGAKASADQSLTEQTAASASSDQSLTEQTAASASSDQSLSEQKAASASAENKNGQEAAEQITVNPSGTGSADKNTASQSVTAAAGINTANRTGTKAGVNSSNNPAGQSVNNQSFADQTAAGAKADKSSHMDYRMYASIGILAAALLTAGVLFAKKRLNKKKVLAIAATAGVAVIAVWGIKLQSAQDYYNANTQETKAGSNFVTVSIRCDTVAGKKSDSDIPADGVILKKTELPVKKGDTVLDILIEAAKQNKIPLDYEGGENNSLSSAYVKGINDLYEYDFGDQSGWLYSINGKFPGTACGSYEVSKKDDIEWVYTCNLGKDVGR